MGLKGTKRGARAGGLAIAITAALAGFAEAQEATDRDYDGDTIVVTGRLNSTQSVTKSDATIAETPQSVTIIDRDDLDSRAAESVGQALRYAPGVLSEPRGVMTGFDYFYARGFAVDQYLDGLKLLSGAYSLPQPDAYLLERVEVLRGPASVLFGQAAPGGIVNLVRKLPTNTPFADIEVEGGNYNHVQLGFDASAPLTSTLSGRITGLARDSDTQVSFAHERRFLVAPSLTWRPDTATTLSLYATWQDDPSVGYYNWLPANGSVLPNSYRPGARLPTDLYTGEPSWDHWSRNVAMIGDEFEHRFGAHLTVRQKLRYSYATSDFRNLYSSFLDSDDHTLFRYAWALQDNASNIDSDNQLQADFSTGALTHSVLAGVDFQRLRYRQRLGYDFATAPTLDIFDPVYNQPISDPPLASDALQTQQQTGIYLQDQMALGGWRFVLGGRQDWVVAKTTQRIDDFGNYFAGVSETDRQNAFTGRAGLVYVFANGWAPYASFTQSFQPQTGVDFFGNAFAPTRGEQYEAGVKFQPADGNTLLMFSLFSLEQKNVLAADVAHPGEQIQVGAIRSRGFELSGERRINDYFDVQASVSHTDQKVTEGDIDFGPQLGATPSAIPADQAFVWVNYRATGAEEGLSASLGVRYAGESWGDDANTFHVPSATTVDGALRYGFDSDGSWLSNVLLSLNVSNMFDETYVSTCGGVDYCAYGLRRTIVASVRKRF